MWLSLILLSTFLIKDKTQRFLEDNTPCDKAIIIRQLQNKLNCSEEAVKTQFKNDEQQVGSVSEVQKFTRAKKYFAYHFNKKLEENTGISLPLNNHKSELARILKNGILPKDFRDLLSLVLQNKAA